MFQYENLIITKVKQYTKLLFQAQTPPDIFGGVDHLSLGG